MLDIPSYCQRRFFRAAFFGSSTCRTLPTTVLRPARASASFQSRIPRRKKSRRLLQSPLGVSSKHPFCCFLHGCAQPLHVVGKQELAESATEPALNLQRLPRSGSHSSNYSVGPATSAATTTSGTCTPTVSA